VVSFQTEDNDTTVRCTNIHVKHKQTDRQTQLSLPHTQAFSPQLLLLAVLVWGKAW